MPFEDAPAEGQAASDSLRAGETLPLIRSVAPCCAMAFVEAITSKQTTMAGRVNLIIFLKANGTTSRIVSAQTES